MSHPDKKHEQPANSDSAAIPPANRLQPMRSSDATANDQQSAASDHQTSIANADAAPSAASAAAAAAAPSMFAGHADSASSAAISRLSPSQRCPSDPLSVAFSFLNVRDFAAASLVCRQWGRAAGLQSAWPAFSVERLIHGLVEDEDRWEDSRSVRVHAYGLEAVALQRLAQSPKWRRLVALQVHGCSSSENKLMSEVAQLPHLQSLCLEWARLDDVAAAFGFMAPRLLALKCVMAAAIEAIVPHLHLLSNLRALALNRMDEIDGCLLLPLHQLEYLELRWADSFSRDLLLVIRRLSVQHRLRHLSVGPSYTGRKLDLDPLVAELSGSDSGLAPAALVSIRLNGEFTAASSSALLSLPKLTRLHWSGNDAPVASLSTHQQPPKLLSPLQQMHLNFYCNCDGGTAQLLQLVVDRTPLLRELHIYRPPPSFGQLIPRVRSLRLLNLTLLEPSSLSQELLQSLASLPLFSELIVRQQDCESIVLGQDGWLIQPLHLTVETLSCIAESSTWRLIRVIGRCVRPQLTLPDDVSAQLAERLADFRVRTEWGLGAAVSRLAANADGAVTWQQTTI